MIDPAMPAALYPILAELNRRVGILERKKFHAILATQQRITSLGANTWTKPTGLIYAYIEVQGSGGAGGGAPATGASEASAGCGGQAGAYVASLLAASALGATETATVATGGVANSGAAGSDGGTSSFGSLIIAPGGTGGSTVAAATTNVATSGGYTAQSMTGQLQIEGGAGDAGFRFPPAAVGGRGGEARLGAGGGSRGGANTGRTPTGYGGGGGGATNTPSLTAKSGGAGANGIIVVWEIY